MACGVDGVREGSLAEEVVAVEFKDIRLSKRLVKLAEGIGARPNMSIPTACHGRGEMEAAYRFFNNDKVTPEGILQSHVRNTLERISVNSRVLLIQDTTELDLTRPNQQVLGAGPMSSSKTFGAFVHPLFAVSEDGIPLGSVWMKTWARTELKDQTSAQKPRDKKQTPIEEKESLRWLEGLRAARDVAEQSLETQCIVVADSEADVYELFAEPRETSHSRPLELLIRCCQNRRLDDSSHCMLEAVRATDCRYTCRIDIGPRKALISQETRKRRATRSARSAEVEVRACTLTLRPPPRQDRQLPAVTLNVVLVEETAPPPGEEPICWLLATTLPIDTQEAVQQIVAAYCIRWTIEVFFKTLKSGCRVEERQFETLSRALNCLALYMIIAWRILWLCRIGRECPELPCDVVFESSEWKAVYKIVQRKDPPKTPPSLNEMIRMIASLGGYVRRSKTQPGTKTLWIGLQRMHDFANCWDAFGPETRRHS